MDTPTQYNRDTPAIVSHTVDTPTQYNRGHLLQPVTLWTRLHSTTGTHLLQPVTLCTCLHNTTVSRGHENRFRCYEVYDYAYTHTHTWTTEYLQWYHSHNQTSPTSCASKRVQYQHFSHYWPRLHSTYKHMFTHHHRRHRYHQCHHRQCHHC